MGEKETIIKKIQDILEKSGLSQEDKELWLNRCQSAPVEALSLFINVFSEDQEMLISATENLKKKIDADGDVEKTKKIVEEEKIELLRQSMK